jgi:outer membrane protein OmpA-like peptidoglycan-associated protein
MKSDNYLSATKANQNIKSNYNKPILLYIYGGTGICGCQEELGVSKYVKNTSWETYSFEFRPSKTIRYITFEASYKRPTLFPYNGNILMDNAGVIKQVACPGEEIIEDIVAAEAVIPPHKRRKKKEVIKSEKEANAANTEDKKKSILNLDRKKLKKDLTIEIKKLYFTADTSSIDEASNEVLDEIYSFLNENQDVVIEIGGHTNGLPVHAYCDKLSLERAKAVATYLIQKGIAPNRVEFKGYGKRRPIASNLSKRGRTKNQRVEIKILSFDS